MLNQSYPSTLHGNDGIDTDKGRSLYKCVFDFEHAFCVAKPFKKRISKGAFVCFSNLSRKRVHVI